jgi:hypothetical protein
MRSRGNSSRICSRPVPRGRKCKLEVSRDGQIREETSSFGHERYTNPVDLVGLHPAKRPTGEADLSGECRRGTAQASQRGVFADPGAPKQGDGFAFDSAPPTMPTILPILRPLDVILFSVIAFFLNAGRLDRAEAADICVRHP